MSMAMDAMDGSPKKTFHMKSFDILRGMSIILMLIAHIQHYWLISEDLWLIGLIFIGINLHGTSGFTFVSGLGFGYSWIRKKDRQISKKERTLSSLSHSLILLGFSFVFNFIAASVRKDAFWFEFIWYWNILQCIVISRILGLLVIRLKKGIQIMIICVCWFLGSYFAFNLIPVNEIDSNFYWLIYYIFYNPFHADSILIYFPFFMVGAWLGEDIYKMNKSFISRQVDANSKSKAETSSFTGILKKWILISCLIFLSGIIIGFPIRDLDYGWNLLAMINIHPLIEWNGLPIWLIPNSYAWVFTCLSVEIWLTLIFSRRYDFTSRHHKVKFLMLFGKYSLTIYFGHYLLLFLPWLVQNFSALTIWIPMFSYIFLIGFIVYLIDKNKKNYYMLESFIQRSAKLLNKKLGF